MPDRGCVELAEITLSLGENLNEIKSEAAKLGADTIIILGGASTTTSVSRFAFGSGYYQSQENRIKCFAIKFKQIETNA